MATDGDSRSSSDNDPLSAMKSLGRASAAPTARTPAAAALPKSDGARPTGAAAFVAREKAGGAGRSGVAVIGLAVAGAVAIGAASFGAWALGGSGSEVSPPAPTAAAPKPESRAPATDHAALDKERERKAAEIAESKKQIEALNQRRADLQKQVVELTGPLSPDANEADAAPKPATPIPPVKGAAAATEPADAPEAFAAEEDPEPETAIAAVDPSAEAPNDGAGAPDGAETVARAPVRVFIHVRAGDPDALARAEAIADELRREGVEVAGIRGVPRAVRTDMVRFFYDADESAVATLDRAMANSAVGRRAAPPLTQDFRNRKVAPKPGTLEIWLS